jgi:hypothetical protein
MGINPLLGFSAVGNEHNTLMPAEDPIAGLQAALARVGSPT